MNAITCLCHFCEAHGPCVLFSTGILSNEVQDSGENTTDGNVCNACTSIGHKAVITSTSPDGIRYFSRQKQLNREVTKSLKQAAFRSLSCEVSPTKEGGCFYFGDSERGHVMSYNFQMKDSLARGLKRWFSVIIFMKDKMFLLNLMAYLLEHIQVCTKELQNNAEVIFENDQKLCSQRALRLQNGKAENAKPRSLVELTGNPNVYNYIHQSFTQILDIARQTFTETLYSSFNSIHAEENMVCAGENTISEISLRKLNEIVGVDIFPKLIYCILVGIQVIIRTEITKSIMIAGCLNKLTPNSSFEMTQTWNTASKEKLVCCSPNVAVPTPCKDICRIDIIDDLPVLYWLGECPQKYPSLLKQILNAVQERRMDDAVLMQQVYSLKEEWIGISATIKIMLDSPEGANNVMKMKQVLGVKPEDNNLLNYWTRL